MLVCRGAFIDAVDGISVANVPDSPSDTDEIQSASSANAYGSDVDMFDAVWRTFIGNATYPAEPDIRAPLNFRPLFVQKCLKAEADLAAADYGGLGQLPTAGVSKDSLGTWYCDVRGLRVAGRPLSSILPDHGKQYAAANICVSADISFVFEQSIQIMRSRRRLITITKGYIGLAPSGVKREDQVWVQLGCLVPLILRAQLIAASMSLETRLSTA